MINKIKNNSKNLILDSALDVFVKKGYAETRMEDIVELSGLSKGAIYHHYNSKRDLFLSLIEHWENYSFPNIFNKDLDKNTASDVLRQIVKDIVNSFKNNKKVFLAELEFWSLANHDDDVRNKTKQLYIKLLKLFKSIISHGIKNNEFKNIDLEIGSLSIMTSIQGIIWFSIFEESKLSAEQYLNEVMEFIIKGLKK
ncbi:MAG: hypothetical protein CMG64_05215 [Candidatus Marinimicrobia bacterium]|nr:hypothetical protein [Candidatus Neomarinimicrobiota bacterium]|tara:strand:- start:591 stop:1181 length:591 start_codon:yes stop_codon:yes gene_type:complete